MGNCQHLLVFFLVLCQYKVGLQESGFYTPQKTSKKYIVYENPQYGSVNNIIALLIWKNLAVKV